VREEMREKMRMRGMAFSMPSLFLIFYSTVYNVFHAWD
jgi:hypothetical protein